MSSTRKGAFFRLFLLLALVGTLGLVAILTLVRHEQHVLPGGEIRFDDFGFRVLEVQDSGANPAGARRLVVTLEVDNHAKRVPFDLDCFAPVLVQPNQRVIPLDASERAHLSGMLAPGEQARAQLAYEVPADAHDLRLEIRWGGPLEYLLEAALYGQKDIALTATDAASGR